MYNTLSVMQCKFKEKLCIRVFEKKKPTVKLSRRAHRIQMEKIWLLQHST